jgi:hypothetical protein
MRPDASSCGSLVFTASRGGPLRRSLFTRRVWVPAAERASLPGITFHGLRHSFVAILVAAGCNVREVSEWAGHNNVAFTLTRYGGLFEDGSDEAVSRLDALLGGSSEGRDAVIPLHRGGARRLMLGQIWKIVDRQALIQARREESADKTHRRSKPTDQRVSVNRVCLSFCLTTPFTGGTRHRTPMDRDSPTVGPCPPIPLA